MAKAAAPKVESDDFSDLIDDLDDMEATATPSDEEGDEESEGEEELDLDEVVSEVKKLVEDAVDFMNSDFAPDWERAEEFLNGETDIPIDPDRSKAVDTVFRDSVRAVKPNLMRIFSQSTAIVQYLPANNLNFPAATIAEAQTTFVTQLFWSSGGYLALANNVHNTLVKRFGVFKASFNEVASDKYHKLTNVAPEELAQLKQMPDVKVISSTSDSVTGLLQVELLNRRSSGTLSTSCVNLLGFFIDDAATSDSDATIIGERSSVTVGYAKSIGLEYDDWLELDDHDVEDDGGKGDGNARRGYDHNMELEGSVDVSNHRFLLTEAYASFDLDGTGLPQLYRFWLGGTSYEYLDHDRVEENPYAIAQIDPVPGSFAGRSFFDLLREDQNVQTSLLRATIDNAHLSNNRRLGVHDTLVNMQDVMNSSLSAPIRFKAPGMIQEIGVQSTISTMLPLLQHLRQKSEIKAGITNAAMGLDPDALQSTDKDAVRNTIQLSQGQVELICRNFGETGLKVLFTKLLKLSLRHNPRQQIIEVHGQQVLLDQKMFNPDLTMEVRVGMGNNSPELQLTALQQISAKQEQMMQQYGINNPICNVQQYLNCIVDMCSLMGVRNVGRYFNAPTPEVAQQLQQIMEQKAAAAGQEPPSKAVIAAETIRAQAMIEKEKMIDSREREDRNMKTVNDMSKALMADDLNRDKLAQDLAIENAKLVGGEVNSAWVQFEQGKAREHDLAKQAITAASGRQNAADQERMTVMNQEHQKQLATQQQEAQAAQAAQRQQGASQQGGRPPPQG